MDNNGHAQEEVGAGGLLVPDKVDTAVSFKGSSIGGQSSTTKPVIFSSSFEEKFGERLKCIWAQSDRARRRQLLNWQYCKPYGVIKCLQIAVTVAFLVFLLPTCLQNHCFHDHEWLFRTLLISAAVFGLVGSGAFLVVHLVRSDGIDGILADHCTPLKVFECLHVLCSTLVYFVVRYYCAHYYGAVKYLRGRWSTLLGLSWALAVLYIIESFVVLGINIRCGGKVQHLVNPYVGGRRQEHMTLQQAHEMHAI